MENQFHENLKKIIPKRCFPASTTITEVLFICSGYHRLTSTVKKSCNSLANSMEVGPPPTTKKVKSLDLSASEILLLDALSKHSMILFLKALLKKNNNNN